MSIKNYYEDINKQEISINITSKNLNSIGTCLRTLKNKLKNKKVSMVNFSIKIEYSENIQQ